MGTEREHYTRGNPPPWDRQGFEKRAFEMWRARLGDLDHDQALGLQCRNCHHPGIWVPWVLVTRYNCLLSDQILHLVRFRGRCSKCGARANRETFVYRMRFDRIAGYVSHS